MMTTEKTVFIPDYFKLREVSFEWLLEKMDVDTQLANPPAPRPEWGAFDPALHKPVLPPKPPTPGWYLPEPPPISADQVTEQAKKRWAAINGERRSKGLTGKHRAEWDFADLIEECGREEDGVQLLEDCLFYELARESAAIRCYVENLRDAKRRGIELQARMKAEGTEALAVYGEDEAIRRDWNVAFHRILEAIKFYDRHNLLTGSGFPDTPWLAYPRERRPRRDGTLLKGGAVQIVSQDRAPLIQSFVDQLPVSILFQQHAQLTVVIDKSAGRKQIEEAWKRQLKQVLAQLNVEKLAGKATPADGLRALSALRLSRLTDSPWIAFGSRIKEPKGNEAPYGDQKSWQRLVKRADGHFRRHLNVDSKERLLSARGS